MRVAIPNASDGTNGERKEPPPRTRRHQTNAMKPNAMKPDAMKRHATPSLQQPFVTYPVQVLREHGVALEAALSVCLADPSPKSVHRLRTETRRLEAQLFLLAELPTASDLPEHSAAAAHLRKELQRLRRAAGTVRDFDVHRKMLESFTIPEPNPTDRETRMQHAPEAANAEPEEAQATAENARTLLADGANTLRKHLSKHRDAAAEDLQRLLKKRQTKAVRAIEQLLKQLRPAENLALPAPTLLAMAESLLGRTKLPGHTRLPKAGEDDLHDIRKAAKAARYLAETLPGDATAEAAARRFEALQEAGGHWHDALEMARAARHVLGRSHELHRFFRTQRKRGLAAYLQALESETRTPPGSRVAPKAKRKRVAA